MVLLSNQLGTGGATKTDEFSEKFHRGEVLFNPKIDIADFGPFLDVFRKKIAI